jgi:hypothetical protein
VEGGKGAAYGLAFGVLGKAVAGVAKWAAPAVQRVAATPAGQFVQRTVQSAVGKVAETAVGRGAAHAAQATGRAASSVGSKVASGARALGAEADDLAARVGLERAAQAPTQLGKALARVEEGAGRAIANAFGAGSPPAPAAAPLAAGVEAGSAEATVAAGGGGAGRLFWGFWKDYPKVVEAGREYAQIGGRLYTEHAVGRMLPRAMGGRGIAPAFVEEAIATGTQTTQVVGGVTRTVYTSGTVQVFTEQSGRIIVSVNPFSGVP